MDRFWDWMFKLSALFTVIGGIAWGGPRVMPFVHQLSHVSGWLAMFLIGVIFLIVASVREAYRRCMKFVRWTGYGQPRHDPWDSLEHWMTAIAKNQPTKKDGNG